MLVKKQWEEHWKKHATDGATGTFYGKWLFQEKLKLIDKVLAPITNKDYPVLDIGCGSGITLQAFRRRGFHNLYGVDTSPSALKRCDGVGHVFLQDARKIHFPNWHFGIVFEEGLWEHYTNYAPFVLEACRLTFDYLIAIQPNHYSFVGATVKIGWEIFSKNKGGVKEHSIPLSHFRALIEKQGFKQVAEQSVPFRTCSCMVFRRKSNAKNE